MTTTSGDTNDRLRRLASEECKPCEGIDPLSSRDVEEALKDLPGWTFKNGSIEREFRFPTYKAGLDFAHAVGTIADEQDHHPDMVIGWRRVRVTWSTHSIKGLSGNDLIMAAKSELVYEKSSSR